MTTKNNCSINPPTGAPAKTAGQTTQPELAAVKRQIDTPILPQSTRKGVPTPTLRLQPGIAGSDDDISGRSLPYVLRGRDEEISRLAAALHNPKRTTFVLEGPPGCGKTTLAAGLSAYAHRQGYTVLRLQAAALEHPIQLIHALWCCFDPDGPLQGKSKTDHTGGGLSFKFFSIEKAFDATEQYTGSDNIVTNIQTCYHQHQARSNGILIIMDNAASWRHETKNKQLKNICESLLDGVRDIGVPILTLYAGTPGTVQTITKLTGNRLERNSHYRLQGVRTSAIAQILQDHLNVQVPDTGLRLPNHTITGAQIASLAETCQGNVLHANAVGYYLQQDLLADPHAIRHEDTTLMGIAEYAKAENYNQMYNNIKDKNHIAFTTLAHAIHTNQQLLYPQDAEDLLTATTADIENPMTLEDYAQEGLLEYMRTEYNYARYPVPNKTENYYRIPIPSFADWLYKKHAREREKIDAAIREHLPNPVSITPWHKTSHDHIYSTPSRAKKAMPENFATGNPSIALPLIPGDGPDAPKSWAEVEVDVEV